MTPTAGWFPSIVRTDKNKSNIIVGVIRNFTAKYPEGMTRVVLLGDPSRDLGALAEPECRRILAALDLAEEMGVPLEWFPISAGAKISMDSGVENMDWIARVLRRMIEFTQAGGEVNLVVNGINVGAQPYWNAEATMLMHTRGILIMTPKAAMVLTGKRALDYSGSVSAEDNQGIGGYDRIMGLNGQAQYLARDIDRGLPHSVAPLRAHLRRAGRALPAAGRYQRSHRPRCADVSARATARQQLRARGRDLLRRNQRRTEEVVRHSQRNEGGRRPGPSLRWSAGPACAAPKLPWSGMPISAAIRFASSASNPTRCPGWDLSRPTAPTNGPPARCFPLSSKKVARAINAASNNRPVVILANLSGFDGSPESMRKLQLEYGAEIGRAVVNFKGPMVFCVISRYHGGAYVVFSRALNEQLEVVALEGTYASVIGGAPAAAVVFAGEVEARARKDARLEALTQAMAKAEGKEKAGLRAQWNELFKVVHSEKLGEMAEEFDRVHSVHRALEVGALHQDSSPRHPASLPDRCRGTRHANGRSSC